MNTISWKFECSSTPSPYHRFVGWQKTLALAIPLLLWNTQSKIILLFTDPLLALLLIKNKNQGQTFRQGTNALQIFNNSRCLVNDANNGLNSKHYDGKKYKVFLNFKTITYSALENDKWYFFFTWEEKHPLHCVRTREIHKEKIIKTVCKTCWQNIYSLKCNIVLVK